MKTTTGKPIIQGFGTVAPTWQLWLDGPEDLVSVLNYPPSKDDTAQRSRELRALTVHPEFYGASVAEATEVILKGSPKLGKLVESLAERITEKLPPPKSRRRTRKWSEDGDEVDLDRLRRGQDAWISSHRVLRSSCGLIELVASWGEGCNASQEQLQWSGAAALAVTDLLEKADYSVELALVACMARPDMVELVRVDLKRMGQIADLEKLAAIAVYPPAWRIFGLGAFQLGPMSSGDAYNDHPHGRALSQEPNGMWNYRPNVMTVTLHGARSESQAISMATEALLQVQSLVNPQDSDSEAV